MEKKIMEDTKYGAARGLIKFVLVVNLLIGLLAAILGLLALENVMWGGTQTLEFSRGDTSVFIGLDKFIFIIFIPVVYIIFALVSYAIYEFFKAFLDLVDNSHLIKENLVQGRD